jgi:hypothetical protein
VSASFVRGAVDCLPLAPQELLLGACFLIGTLRSLFLSKRKEATSVSMFVMGVLLNNLQEGRRSVCRFYFRKTSHRT